MRYEASSAGNARYLHWFGAKGFGAVSVLALALLSGCATAPPPKPPVRPAIQPRAPTEDDRFKISAALAPLLLTAGVWRGPEEISAVGVSVLPQRGTKTGAAPHPPLCIA